MPRIAPPPFGREGDGSGLGFFIFPSSEVAALVGVLLTNVSPPSHRLKRQVGQKLNLPPLERNLNSPQDAFKRQPTKFGSRRGMSHNFVPHESCDLLLALRTQFSNFLGRTAHRDGGMGKDQEQREILDLFYKAFKAGDQTCQSRTARDNFRDLSISW